MSSTLLWGFVGTLVPVMSNSLRKLPLMRHMSCAVFHCSRTCRRMKLMKVRGSMSWPLGAALCLANASIRTFMLRTFPLCGSTTVLTSWAWSSHGGILSRLCPRVAVPPCPPVLPFLHPPPWLLPLSIVCPPPSRHRHLPSVPRPPAPSPAVLPSIATVSHSCPMPLTAHHRCRSRLAAASLEERDGGAPRTPSSHLEGATVYMESNLERVRTSRAAAEAKIAVRRALAAEAAASPSSPPSSSTPATTSAASVDE